MTARPLFLLLAVSAPVWADDIFDPKSKLKVEAGGGVGGEGPAWHPELGVLCSGNNNINRVALDGKVSVYRKGAGTNGLLFDRDGSLLACEPGHRRVTRQDKDGKITVLATMYEGKRLTEPNDITVSSKGYIYFSDPCYGDRSKIEIKDDKGRPLESVYRRDPDGSVMLMIGSGIERANGVLVSADDKYLYVADNNNNVRKGARKLYRFDLSGASPNLNSQKLIYDWGEGRGPDGLKQDEKGRLYVAAGLNKPNPPFEPAADVKGGIYVIDPESGKLLAFLPVPTDEVTNCAFGGEDRKTLYITAGGTLYSIRTTTPGRVVYPPAK